MSGETALAKLKENPNFKIPTIALTADAVAGAQEKYIGEGFIDYLAKPFSKEQIREKIDEVFSINPEKVEIVSEVFTEPLETDNQEVIPLEVVKPVELLQEENPSFIVDVLKYDLTVDRFKDVEAHVFGGEDEQEKEA